jgi:hypothetical protein
LKALIIDEPWVSMIILGKKTWEMRSRNTNVRGRIGLIRKGSKTVVGVAHLVETIPHLSTCQLRANIARHRVPEEEIDDAFKWTTIWVLDEARPLRKAVPYGHPTGAVIWVNLNPAVTAAIEAQLVGG